MKRLTLNQVAKANIRMNRKAYVSLFIGILLAVFLTTCTSLCAWGTVRGHEEQMAQRVGWMDMYLLGNHGPTDEQLRSCGFFQRIGHVMVDACEKETGLCTGYYDEEAEKLMNRTLVEGRMPEKAGEIAAELSALIRMDLDKAEVGDVLKLTMKPVYGTEEEKTFTLVGILNEQTEYLNREYYTSYWSQESFFRAMIFEKSGSCASRGAIRLPTNLRLGCSSSSVGLNLARAASIRDFASAVSGAATASRNRYRSRVDSHEISSRDSASLRVIPWFSA